MDSARKIRRFRKRFKLSRFQLAHLTDYSFWAVTSYEQGKRKPGRRFLEKLGEIERAAGGAPLTGIQEGAELLSLKARVAAVEARVGAVESRYTAVEMRQAQIEARAEAALPPPAEAPGVAVRGAIQVGSQEPGAAERQADEKTARAKR